MAVQRLGRYFDDIHFTAYDQPTAVASGATPNTPYPGLMVYETNTEKGKVWDGTTWNPFAVGAAHQTTTVSTSWNSAGNPTVTYELIGRIVYADYSWTLTQQPTEAVDLLIDLPPGLASRYGDHPIGIARLTGFTSYDVEVGCRTGSSSASFYIENEAGVILHRTTHGATTGDTIRCQLEYEVVTTI